MKKCFNIYLLFILLAGILWGTAGIFVRTIGDSLPSQFSIVLDRAFFSCLILSGLILFKDKRLFKIKLKDLWLFVCAAFFSIILFNFSYYKTMTLTSLSVAAVLLYTAPFFVVIISAFCFKEKITIKKTVALLIAFLGCCLVSGAFSSGGKLTPKALLFGLLTGFGYALYTIFSQSLINKGYQTLTITFYTFFFAFLGSIPLSRFPETVKATFSSSSCLMVVFLMALINTVLPYLFYTSGLKGVESSTAPIIATIEPVVATLISVLIYKETLMLSAGLGIILVLSSVVILNVKGKTNENTSKC